MKLAILTLLSLLSSLALAQAPASAPSQTRFAQRSIRFAADDFGPDGRFVQELLQKRTFELARVLDLTPEEMSKYVTPQYGVTQTGVEGTITLVLPPDRGKPVAKEFMDQLIAGLESPLRQAYDRNQIARSEPVSRELLIETQRLEGATAKARELREKLRDVAGRADVSNNGIQTAVARLEEERQKLELDVMGKTARREALEEEIARQSERAAKKVDDDPIAAELQKVVEVREKRVNRIEQKYGKDSPAADNELSEAIAQAAETRAKLLERRHDAITEAGGATLETFNRELLTLSVDLRELTAREKFVKRRLDALRQALDLLDPLNQAEADLTDARANTASAKYALRQVQKQIDASKPPVVEILSSTDSAEAPKPSSVELQ
ncbi:MAG: hypothetical protein ABIP55_16710 [Tepidisphaeraceae bacterium]